jgi:hypothetical protein
VGRSRRKSERANTLPSTFVDGHDTDPVTLYSSHVDRSGCNAGFDRQTRRRVRGNRVTVGRVLAHKNQTLLGKSQSETRAAPIQTYSLLRTSSNSMIRYPKSLLMFELSALVPVTDVAEDDSNQQTLKGRQEKTGCQSDSFMM